MANEQKDASSTRNTRADSATGANDGTAADLATALASATPADLKAALKLHRAATAADRATDAATTRLSTLRTHAVRARAWATAQTAKACTADDRADKAETALAALEAKLGCEPATDDEVASTLARLVAEGRVAQPASTTPEPPSDAAAQEVADAA